MAWEALSVVRDLGRLHEISSVFIRHGLGDLVRRWRVHPKAIERVPHALQRLVRFRPGE